MTIFARAQQRRIGAAPPLRRLGVVLLAALAPIALLITLWPTHALLLIKTPVIRFLTALHDRGIVEWLTWVRLEILANVAMLVPISFALVCILGARRWLTAVAACVAASLAVELVQWAMPGRIGSPLDVVTNGLGALVGAALAVLAERLHSRALANRDRPSAA